MKIEHRPMHNSYDFPGGNWTVTAESEKDREILTMYSLLVHNPSGILVKQWKPAFHGFTSSISPSSSYDVYAFNFGMKELK